MQAQFGRTKTAVNEKHWVLLQLWLKEVGSWCVSIVSTMLLQGFLVLESEVEGEIGEVSSEQIPELYMLLRNFHKSSVQQIGAWLQLQTTATLLWFQERIPG